MRRPVVILPLVVVLLGSAPVRAAAVPVLVIDGRGHGHGVGMAQDGAFWMGKGGSSTAQILNQFYPGTSIGRSTGEVRVGVFTAPGNAVVVRFPNGGEVRDAREGGQSPGFPVRIGAGGQARLRFDGRQFVAEFTTGATAAPAAGAGRPGGGLAAASTGPTGGNGPVGGVESGAATARQEPPPTGPPSTTTTSAPALGLLPGPGRPLPLLPLPTGPLLPLPTVPLLTTTTAVPSTTAAPGSSAGRAVSARPLWAVPGGGGTVEVIERGARYRGMLQALGGGPLRLVNHVDVEQYLRGMGEVRNPSWPSASLRAQAIAARTYAMRAVAGGGELCDTQQCQVYLGAQAEYPAMDKAVSATRGQVLMFRRALASAVYSSNGGGFSASTEEGFGTPATGYPYLRPARYATSDPGPWSVTVALRDVGARVGYRGKVSGVRTRAGPSGRVVEATVEGSKGALTVSGIDFDRALGLRSTMFTVRSAEAAAPPPPPPTDGGPVQGLPGGDAAVPAADGAVAAPVPTAGPAVAEAAVSEPASSSPTAASRAALGALAWLLLVVVAGAGAGMRIGARRTSGHPPPAD